MNSELFNGKNVLVTGGTGLIGKPLVDLLIGLGACVRIASLDSPQLANPRAEFHQVDLTHVDNCLKVTKDINFVFHLAGIKGSPAMAAQKPASFFYPTICFNTHMLEAARRNKVEKYLFTSTVGVYAPAEVLQEDSVWKSFPSENDRFAGWAKRMGELQLEAYRIEYGWKYLNCVRPANVYGPFDNFDPKNSMVIPALINRALTGENPFIVWGDGSAVRDFIYSEDCARGILQVFEKNPQQPVNLGSGTGISIKELVETLSELMPQKLNVSWDTMKPSGDRMRILDSSRAKSLGFEATTSLRAGLEKTLAWFKDNQNSAGKRYNVFI